MSSTMLASTKILEKFDGTNFHAWKVKMETVLDKIFGMW